MLRPGQVTDPDPHHDVKTYPEVKPQYDSLWSVPTTCLPVLPLLHRFFWCHTTICLLTIKRLCNWGVPNTASILAYCTHHELYSNTPLSMFNTSVWFYLKQNAAESQRLCWMTGTWNQWGGKIPAHFHLCLYKGYTMNQAPGKHTEQCEA